MQARARARTCLHIREERCVARKVSLAWVQGDGLTMGGLLIVAKGDEGVKYAYAEEVFGDHAGNDVILQHCRAIAGQS